jgi:hypothetical protein
VVPRYVDEPRRRFAGQTFKDKRQGRIFRGADRGRVRGSVLDAIAEHIRAQLPE